MLGYRSLFGTALLPAPNENLSDQQPNSSENESESRMNSVSIDHSWAFEGEGMGTMATPWPNAVQWSATAVADTGVPIPAHHR